MSPASFVATVLLLALASAPSSHSEPLSIVSFDCGTGVNYTIADESITSPWGASRGYCWGNVITGLDRIYDVTYYLAGGATSDSGNIAPKANATIFLLEDLEASYPVLGEVITTFDISASIPTKASTRVPVKASFNAPDGLPLDSDAPYFIAYCADTTNGGDMTYSWGTKRNTNSGFFVSVGYTKGSFSFSVATELTFDCTKPSPSPSPSTSASPSPSRKPESSSGAPQLDGVFRTLLGALLLGSSS